LVSFDDGEIVNVCAIGNSTVTLIDEDPRSEARDRFYLSSNNAITYSRACVRCCLVLRYDGSLRRWRTVPS
jgi:hypothetical protein